MGKGHLCISLVVALTLVLAPASAHAHVTTDLATALDAILDDPRLDGAIVGVSVRSAATGAQVYEHNGHLRLMPGSNQKLVTSTTALAALDPEFRFRTRVMITAPARN
jgi:serine-type D-Ala-D-Ala carboxypeptidase/endopeptidase (penicillin-binding protein 4)